MDNIYFNCVLIKKIIVESKFLNENIDEYIETFLKQKVEGTCIDEGYVKEGTVKILKKSIGKLFGSRFTGDITYEVAYTANVCNPVIGNVIECKVKFVNKLGILGNNGPITIIIGKQFHSKEDSLSKISENDIVKVEVIAKKFSLNDKEIKIIAKLWQNDNDIIDTKKQIKKDLTSSDLTPILQENDFIDNDNQEDFDNNSDENDQYSVDEEDDDDIEDDIVDSDEEEDIKVENPESINLNIEDIELDEEDEKEDDEYDDDLESVNEYE